MSRPRPAPRAVLAALLAGAACTRLHLPLPDEDRPSVEVLAIAARFPTDTTGQLDLRLAILNPKEETFLASLVTWEIRVDGHPFSTGLQALSFEVPPREERVLYVTTKLAFQRMPLRPGPVRLAIGLRGRVKGQLGTEGLEQGFPFARQMEVVCESAPRFPLPGESPER